MVDSRKMIFNIELPNDSLSLAEVAEVETEAKRELLFALYRRGLLSIGKATELAGVTRAEFEAILAARQIERPFDSAELERDLAWARQAD